MMSWAISSNRRSNLRASGICGTVRSEGGRSAGGADHIGQRAAATATRCYPRCGPPRTPAVPRCDASASVCEWQGLASASRDPSFACSGRIVGTTKGATSFCVSCTPTACTSRPALSPRNPTKPNTCRHGLGECLLVQCGPKKYNVFPRSSPPPNACTDRKRCMASCRHVYSDGS